MKLKALVLAMFVLFAGAACAGAVFCPVGLRNRRMPGRMPRTACRNMYFPVILSPYVSVSDFGGQGSVPSFQESSVAASSRCGIALYAGHRPLFAGKRTEKNSPREPMSARGAPYSVLPGSYFPNLAMILSVAFFSNSSGQQRVMRM